MSVNQFCGEQAFDFQHTYVAKLVQLIITLVNQILRGEDIRFKKLLQFVHIVIPGQNGSVGKMIYNNVLHILGYLLVMLFLLLAMRRSYQEQIQTEAKKKAL